MDKTSEIKKTKLIYNPLAGKKRHLNPLQTVVTLEDIKDLLYQYQIPVDYAPTKYVGHATKLARESVKEGYDTVIVAGGDGTVEEVINGLVGTNIILGILPIGSVMNDARMLAIPLDIEKAVQLLKIRRVRKIDVGVITKLSGEKIDPFYFTEQAGIGIDAVMHRYASTFFNKKMYGNIFRIINTFLNFSSDTVDVYLNDSKIKSSASLVIVSNGPIWGPGLSLTPHAKLNDHKLTVSLYEMSKTEPLQHLIGLILGKKPQYRKIKSFKSNKIRIESKIPKMVHADSRIYGETPVECTIYPNALSIITGFPKEGQSTFKKRAYLDL